MSARRREVGEEEKTADEKTNAIDLDRSQEGEGEPGTVSSVALRRAHPSRSCRLWAALRQV